MKYIVAPMLFALALAFPSPIPQADSTECSQEFTDNILFNSSMEEFQAAKAAGEPSGCDFSDNGCTASPDQPFGFEFLPSCQRHDFAYRNFKLQGRFETDKSLADDQFLKDMEAQCETEGGAAAVAGCKATANVYFFAVSNFGSKKRSLE